MANKLYHKWTGHARGFLVSPSLLIDLLGKGEPIAKGVSNTHFVRPPGRRLYAGSGIFVLLARQFLVIGNQPFGSDAYRTARAAIPVMLGNVQRAAILRDAHIERKVLLEAMLKIDLKAEKVDVEFLGFGFVKTA